MKPSPLLIKTNITGRIIQIGDSIGNACTLIHGDRQALLFDTMTGACDLKGYIESITDLPLTVVLSHGHFDHAFGSWQFGEIWLNASERKVLAENRLLLPEIIRNTDAVLPEKLVSGDFEVAFHDLSEGDLFDLGGITAEAVALPGHTEGSTGLLIREERILLVGDAISPQMTMIFEESMDLSVYFQTLEKAKKLPIDSFIGSHFMKAFPVSAIDTFKKCAENIGKKNGMKYTFTPVPKYRGMLWLYEIRDPEIDETVCIIIKDS